MEYPKAKQLAEIIVKIRLRKATDKERAFLNDWLDESEINRQTYKKIIRGEAIARRLQTEEQLNQTTDFRRIKSYIIHRLTREHRRHIWQRIAWSSAAAACIALFLYLSLPRERDNESAILPSQPTIIAAVPNTELKTLLITADGRQVDLEKQIPDSLATPQALIRGEKGQLSYEAMPLTAPAELQEEWNRVITSVGGEYFITLSDGTRVWLNANTTLEFPVNFIKGKRTVKLQGEAYFEVARDEQRPFIVQTQGMQTQVLGTAFNIKAYHDEPREQTTLLQGRVEVSLSQTSPESPTPRMILEPGMQAQWQQGSQSLSVQAVQPNDIIAWRRGEFIFNEEDIQVVLRTLSRWYGVEFITQDAHLETYTFSGMMSKSDQLEASLEILTLAGGPAFKIEGKQVYMSKNKSRLP